MVTSMAFKAGSALLLLIALLASSCGLVRKIKGERFSFPAHPTENIEKSSQMIDLEGETLNGSTSSLVKSSSTDSQRISGAGALANSSIVIPPGSLAIDTVLTVQEGIGLDNDGTLEEIGISPTQIIKASPAVYVSSSVELDPLLPFQIALKIGADLHLQEANLKYAVIYRANIFADKSVVIGVITGDNIIVENGIFSFSANYWGSYQLFAVNSGTLTETKKVSANPIKKKSENTESVENSGSGTEVGDPETENSDVDSADSQTAFEVTNRTVQNGAILPTQTPSLSWTFSKPVDPSTLT
jgi:hypothetical protein